MTYEEAIDRLVTLDVARWGEGEREASRRLNRRYAPTIGLALNRLAYYDVDNIDEALAKQAEQAMTSADLHALKQGG
jgi:hypothetical protein